MPQHVVSIHRAKDKEAITPLIDLCKKGKLFDIQAWITDGKPVNAPPFPKKGQRRKTPLEYAIKIGFHSVVQVLLEAGAVQEPQGGDAPIYRAIESRRFDIVQLLVDNGFDPQTIDLSRVFESWDPGIMKYFIERGADLVTNQPFAIALCQRIRTALNIYKQCRQKVPELQVQADIALRRHCYDGNMKWASLMLWAGADPFSLGGIEANEKIDDDDEGMSALSWAAWNFQYEIFSIRQIRDKLPGPNGSELLTYLTHGKGIEILEQLLKQGVNPNDQDNGGSTSITRLLDRMGEKRSPYYAWEAYSGKYLADTEETRSQIKGIHLLAKHGARWIPSDKKEINKARRDLLNLKPDYAMEFIWIMQKYRACDMESIRELLRTPSIKSHVAEHRERLAQILDNWVA